MPVLAKTIERHVTFLPLRYRQSLPATLSSCAQAAPHQCQQSHSSDFAC